MEYTVYYYTRTGRSKAVAQKIAAEYNTTARAITDNENWNGVIGFIKGGAKASKKETTPITYDKPQATGDIVLVFPLWAAGYPPAVQSFIDDNGRERIIAIPTSLGTKLKSRDGFKKVIDLVGKEIMDIEIKL